MSAIFGLRQIWGFVFQNVWIIVTAGSVIIADAFVSSFI
jgi:hypothetical protein